MFSIWLVRAQRSTILVPKDCVGGNFSGGVPERAVLHHSSLCNIWHRPRVWPMRSLTTSDMQDIRADD